MIRYPVALREGDIPQEKKRCLFIMKWKEPIIAMRIGESFHTYTLGEKDEILLHSFKDFLSGVEKWCYLSDLDNLGGIWHV